MCLIVEKGTLIQILKKSKTIYKVVSASKYPNKVNSYFRSYQYNIGELQPKQSLELEKDISIMADDACFCDDLDAKAYHMEPYELSSAIRKGELVSYEEGYHFYRNKKRVSASCYKYGLIYVCKIPAGESVIYNKSGLGIASNIIILGAIE